MEFTPHAPSGVLASALEGMFHFRDYNPEHAVERIIPDGTIAVVIELDGQTRHILDNDTHVAVQACEGSWVSGLFSNYLSITPLPQGELIAFRVHAGHAAPLLGVPVSQFNDRVVPGVDVFGTKIVDLRQAILSASTAVDKLRQLEDWLHAQWSHDLKVPQYVTRAIEMIVSEPAIATLKRVHAKSGVSSKHLADLFKRFVGPTPKTFQRIMRFSAAMALVAQQKNVAWADVGAECGYYDQAHFIRDFCRFSGFTPNQFHLRGDDRINFLPEDRVAP